MKNSNTDTLIYLRFVIFIQYDDLFCGTNKMLFWSEVHFPIKSNFKNCVFLFQ